MRKQLVMLIATALGLGTTSAYGHMFSGDEPWFIEVAGMYGPANGRLQTPAGGREGSVTPSEPQFDESDTLSLDILFGRRLGNHLIFMKYRNWGFEGNDTYQSLPVKNPIGGNDGCVTIQNAEFCNGDEINARVDMDWLSFGYGYTFDFTLAGGRSLLVAPSVQADLYRFELEMEHVDSQKSAENGRVDRRYNKGGLRVGGIVEYAQNDWLTWGAKVVTSIVLPSAPASSDFEAYARFRLWDSENTRGSLRAGVGYTYFRYTDQQTVPNDLVVEMGPSPLLALAMQF
jgi:hypothetical protein